LWNVDSGEKILDLSVPGAKIISIAFSRDGQKLYSGSWDGTVRIHDLRSLKTELIPDALGQGVIVSPDGTWLATQAESNVQIVDLASKKITATQEVALSPVSGLMAFSPDGKAIAIARKDRLRANVCEVELCDPRNLHRVTVLREDARAAESLAYSPDGSLLATGGDDGAVVIWDVKANKQTRKVRIFTDPGARWIADVFFSPNGKLLGVAGDGGVWLLRVDSLEAVGKIKGQGMFTAAFSADGKLLLTNRTVDLHWHETKLWKVGRL
jgi:WD40 repeat protein